MCEGDIYLKVRVVKVNAVARGGGVWIIIGGEAC